jgi:hypothetical protein
VLTIVESGLSPAGVRAMPALGDIDLFSAIDPGEDAGCLSVEFANRHITHDGNHIVRIRSTSVGRGLMDELS